MGQLLLDNETHERLGLIAAAWEVGEAEAVARLIARLGSASATPEREMPTAIAIHMDYRGNHVEAEYSPKTQSVTIVSGRLKGRKYPKPSPAACDVVASIAPDLDPHRNGWKYWRVTETDEPLQSIRHAR